jgi:hypothetical protein
MPRVPRLLWAGTLLSMAAAPTLAADPLKRPVEPSLRAPVVRKARPRERLMAGDRWRVRVSSYPVQMPDPTWFPPETWLFAATGVEKTREGPRLVITATRQGSAKPELHLYLDPDTGALMRLDTVLPVQGGERTMVERPTPGVPFVSGLSPVPLAFASPPKPDAPETQAATGEAITTTHQPAAAASGGEQPQFAFTFSPRLTQQTEPVDAGVGRAMIEQGMSPLKLTRRARMEPDGVPRFVTITEGPSLRIEQIWDETTPWPLYTETDTSRSWLVSYTKGK